VGPTRRQKQWEGKPTHHKNLPFSGIGDRRDCFWAIDVVVGIIHDVEIVGMERHHQAAIQNH
jgi:hypothetical protein